MPSQLDRKPETFQRRGRLTGRFPKREAINRGWLLKRLAGHHRTLLRAAEYIEAETERRGGRFDISSRRLGRALGMSQSTGSRCLRKLRDLGLISLWRKHYCAYDRKTQRWTGTPAVHEAVMTHPCGDPPERGESRPLTWDSGPASQRAGTADGARDHGAASGFAASGS